MNEPDTNREKPGVAASAELRDAAIAEIMGDVANLHRSVRDLVAITEDADRRISARVIELRKVAADLASAREAAFAQISVLASEQAQRAFREAMGDLLARMSGTLEKIGHGLNAHAGRQFADRAAVAIVTAAITSVLTLGGTWLLLHFH
ncbi:hypothetical protein R75461_07301 [Paraburkholderia nemoris]|uniref:hypothetical protein n=1 Tax=Paraburkholderia nemoris TaxID=2793076 RepID=UPI00190928A3|nr:MULTISPECIES: hypothetical protein [Paraburkholderia]MBK3786047.1 hypothetical protein [Paraburkholderia aspalathi]CAE6847205.1 hypothetical protein R75461_07301 [Paraburkholderia nemoris]